MIDIVSTPGHTPGTLSYVFPVKHEGKPLTVAYSGGTLTGPRFAITNPFGYYKFDDLTVGETYVIEVAAKRYSFDPSSRVVTLNDEIADMDFEAAP